MEAISAIDHVHHLPADAPAIPILADDQLLTDGHYRPERIALHPGRPLPRLATLHETGHYLDDLVLPPDTTLASGGAATAPWRDTVVQSQAIQNLRALAEDPSIGGASAHIRYLLRFSETFARSYSQWVAVRSDDDSLLDELGRAQLQLSYSEHWDSDDFQPIGAALDDLFAEWT